MKRLTTILCAAALVALAASCNKLAQSENVTVISQDEGMHEVPIYLSTGDAETRAVSSTDVLSDADIPAGTVYAYIFTNETNSKLIFQGYITNGDKVSISQFKAYNIYVICGAKNIEDDLAALKTVDDIRSYELQLSDMAKTEGTYATPILFMYGEASIAKGAESIDVTVTRRVCRIRLVSVTQTEEFKAYAGTMKVKYAFLSNVVSNFYVKTQGTNYTAAYKNKMGRQDQDGTQTPNKSLIINSAEKAYAPTWTFLSSSTSISSWKTYCFPSNYHGGAKEPAGWISPYTDYSGQDTMLVLAATFGDDTTVYYYPINLNRYNGGTRSLGANYSYDITVTISNYGSDEPNQVFKKNSVKANITVSDWGGGEASTIEY